MGYHHQWLAVDAPRFCGVAYPQTGRSAGTPVSETSPAPHTAVCRRVQCLRAKDASCPFVSPPRLSRWLRLPVPHRPPSPRAPAQEASIVSSISGSASGVSERRTESSPGSTGSRASTAVACCTSAIPRAATTAARASTCTTLRAGSGTRPGSTLRARCSLLEGGLRGASMVLEGQGVGADGEIRRHRITWTPNADGSVRQHWESTDRKGQWSTAFDGSYTRK